jgi:hypothetical protein
MQPVIKTVAKIARVADIVDDFDDTDAIFFMFMNIPAARLPCP